MVIFQRIQNIQFYLYTSTKRALLIKSSALSRANNQLLCNIQNYLYLMIVYMPKISYKIMTILFAY